MSNKEDHQAAKLQQLFEEINSSEINEIDNSEPFAENNEDRTATYIDVLNLPPRKEVHSNQSKRARIKVKMPLIRITSVVFLLVTILTVAYYMYINEWLIFIVFPS
ncbi:hypothetical protein ACLIBH_02500 [Virgibacillus sp. W0430]|uniref:hypothetical protein n=1 Tax=Virgibacillus sp. W0430 TaxID=3391580 RepID=UPI003F45DC9E